MIQFENCVERFSNIILSELSEKGIKCWIAGGVVRDYFMGIPMKTDIDLFFPDLENYNKASEHFRISGAFVKWESENGMKVIYDGRTYDLVKKHFSGPQTTIDAFDFTVSMFAVDTERVYYGATSFIDLAKRQLIINALPFPASSMSRAFRYYKKGFNMCQGEMKKLCLAIQDMPKEEPKETTENSDEQVNSSGDSFFTGID